MLGREFVKRIRLLLGRTETIRTRFDLDKEGVLVEHVVLETRDPPRNMPGQRVERYRAQSNRARGPDEGL
jgi:hypothetical protein